MNRLLKVELMMNMMFIAIRVQRLAMMRRSIQRSFKSVIRNEILAKPRMVL